MRVSLLTAVHPPRSTHLPATATSVAAARRVLAGSGHDLEWVVAIDGPGEVPRIDAGPGVRIVRRPMNGGASAARNTALAAAAGEMVMPLDHDDLLDADGLFRLLGDPRTERSAWVAGNAQLLDGSFTAHRVVDACLFQPRQLEEHWSSPFPFHPNIVLARRDAALAAGGWPALSANQDLGYVFSLNRTRSGWALPFSLIRYRTWEEQTVAQGYYPELKALDFAFLIATLNAERAAAGLGPITAPEPGGSKVRDR
jgi:glycosyltransferase involved in cell wall biosynthesis